MEMIFLYPLACRPMNGDNQSGNGAEDTLERSLPDTFGSPSAPIAGPPRRRLRWVVMRHVGARGGGGAVWGPCGCQVACHNVASMGFPSSTSQCVRERDPCPRARCHKGPRPYGYSLQ